MYQIYDHTKFVSRDIMQEIVARRLQSFSFPEGMCRCERCMEAICAKALSLLPPMPVDCIVEDIHARFSILCAQTQVDMVIALCQAVEHVRRHPPH